MANFTDTEAFDYTQRSPMEPCQEPTAADFEDDPNTLIWSNINGVMRLYSYNGVVVQYQIVQLGPIISV